MSTLPRTKSLGGADSNTLPARKKLKVRPSSFCESTWTRIHPTSGVSRLQRSPSQANSLSTTVPTSLVTRPLGGRHTPTRSSLRHSRMVVMNRATISRRNPQWTGLMARVVSLVVSAQIFVGGVGIVLATWLTLWASCIDFKEVPHYAGVPVFLSGLLGAILLICFSKLSKTCFNGIKGTVITLCCISILACISVCVFTSVHLIRLAMPVSCYMEHLLPLDSDSFVDPYSDVEAFGVDPALKEVQKLYEGSGDSFDDEDFEPLPIRMMLRRPNVTQTRCVCEHDSKKEIYTGLSCSEVKNILPIIFVASCFVTFVGAVLSIVIVYIFCSIKYCPYRRGRQSETRPFIYKAKKSLNGNRFVYR